MPTISQIFLTINIREYSNTNLFPPKRQKEEPLEYPEFLISMRTILSGSLSLRNLVIKLYFHRGPRTGFTNLESSQSRVSPNVIPQRSRTDTSSGLLSRRLISFSIPVFSMREKRLRAQPTTTTALLSLHIPRISRTMLRR